MNFQLIWLQEALKKAETENDYDDYDYGYEDDYEIGDMDFAEERF